MIDITKPLELSDGTPVTLDSVRQSNFTVAWSEGIRSFDNDGRVQYSDAVVKDLDCGRYGLLQGRALRNVKEAPKMENDLAARMEALIRRMAGIEVDCVMVDPKTLIHAPRCDYDEARAIIAELDGPKTDEEWAFAIAKEAQVSQSKLHTTLIERGIAKGRELERMERGE